MWVLEKEKTVRTLRTILVVLCVVSLPVAGYAQGAGAPAAKADPVLKLIPAGSLGYVVVNDLKGALANMDKFIADIGLDPLVKMTMPTGLLDGVKTALRLGEGFTGSGGLAVVMLDPAQFDIDMPKLLKAGPSALGDVQLPLVVFVPGASIKDVFPKVRAEAGAKYAKLQMSFGPMMAAESGGYVLLSPTDKALDAVLKAAKKTTDELKEGHAKLLGGSDIAVHLNMKVAGPIVNALLEVLQKELGPMGGGMGPGMRGAPVATVGDPLAICRDMVSQVQALTLGLHFAKGGVVAEVAMDFAPDGMLGKAVAACKPTGGNLVDKLPNLSYVVALGQVGGKASSEELEFSFKQLDALLDAAELKLDAQVKDKIKKLITGLDDQATEQQIVFGGAPEGSGLFALALVLKCKDADKVKALLSDVPGVIQDIVKAAGAQHGGDVKGMKVTYTQGVDSVGDVKIDAIEITPPDSVKPTERDQAEMTAILGEARIRFLIASPDRNTVVMTFGGAKPFMTQALKAVKEGGTIPSAEGVADALAQLPKDPAFVVLLNCGNLFDLIAKITQVSKEKSPPIKLTTKTPVALGAGVSGSSVRLVLFVPTGLIKEGVIYYLSSQAAERAPLGKESF